MKLAERVQRIQPSATLAITARANALKAEGKDIIGFGAGEPDFDTPMNIKRAAIDAIHQGFTKYTPVAGTDELREAIAEKFRRDNNLVYRKSQIVVSCGAKHSLANLSQVLFERGDEVIIPAPYWVSYPDIVCLSDAEPVIVKTDETTNFKMTPGQLSESITKRTKALILNSPSNPTGAVYTRDELAALAEIVLEHDMVVISDDIYEHILYDDVPFCTIANISEEMKEKTIVVNGVSKTYAMTGWRIGYAAGPEEIMSQVAKVQSQNTSNPSSIAQKAALEAIRGGQDTVGIMVSEFQKRRDYIVAALNDIEGISCTMPAGAFYVFPTVSGLYGRSFRGTSITNSTELAAWLLDDALVAVVPGAAFGSDAHMRLSYAASMAHIERGMERISDAVNGLE
ncbi:MAG: pyridoxal phosphate-dependent aminotransferase [Deltaproteobacteria bacterium]|nr:pyridoxal phosphate-dependent aminotransferase [Deltaproteobacteria bacterium]